MTQITQPTYSMQVGCPSPGPATPPIDRPTHLINSGYPQNIPIAACPLIYKCGVRVDIIALCAQAKESWRCEVYADYFSVSLFSYKSLTLKEDSVLFRA